MAAIADAGRQVDVGDFLRAVEKALPSYAQPVFLRLTPHIDTTGLTATHTHARTHTHENTHTHTHTHTYFALSPFGAN